MIDSSIDDILSVDSLSGAALDFDDRNELYETIFKRNGNTRETIQRRLRLVPILVEQNRKLKDVLESESERNVTLRKTIMQVEGDLESLNRSVCTLHSIHESLEFVLALFTLTPCTISGISSLISTRMGRLFSDQVERVTCHLFTQPSDWNPKISQIAASGITTTEDRSMYIPLTGRSLDTHVARTASYNLIKLMPRNELQRNSRFKHSDINTTTSARWHHLDLGDRKTKCLGVLFIENYESVPPEMIQFIVLHLQHLLDRIHGEESDKNALEESSSILDTLNSETADLKSKIRELNLEIDYVTHVCDASKNWNLDGPIDETRFKAILVGNLSLDWIEFTDRAPDKFTHYQCFEIHDTTASFPQNVCIGWNKPPSRSCKGVTSLFVSKVIAHVNHALQTTSLQARLKATASELDRVQATLVSQMRDQDVNARSCSLLKRLAEMQLRICDAKNVEQIKTIIESDQMSQMFEGHPVQFCVSESDMFEKTLSEGQYISRRIRLPSGKNGVFQVRKGDHDNQGSVQGQWISDMVVNTLEWKFGTLENWQANAVKLENIQRLVLDKNKKTEEILRRFRKIEAENQFRKSMARALTHPQIERLFLEAVSNLVSSVVKAYSHQGYVDMDIKVLIFDPKIAGPQSVTPSNYLSESIVKMIHETSAHLVVQKGSLVSVSIPRDSREVTLYLPLWHQNRPVDGYVVVDAHDDSEFHYDETLIGELCLMAKTMIADAVEMLVNVQSRIEVGRAAEIHSTRLRATMDQWVNIASEYAAFSRSYVNSKYRNSEQIGNTSPSKGPSLEALNERYPVAAGEQGAFQKQLGEIVDILSTTVCRHNEDLGSLKEAYIAQKTDPSKSQAYERQIRHLTESLDIERRIAEIYAQFCLSPVTFGAIQRYFPMFRALASKLLPCMATGTICKDLKSDWWTFHEGTKCKIPEINSEDTEAFALFNCFAPRIVNVRGSTQDHDIFRYFTSSPVDEVLIVPCSIDDDVVAYIVCINRLDENRKPISFDTLDHSKLQSLQTCLTSVVSRFYENGKVTEDKTLAISQQLEAEQRRNSELQQRIDTLQAQLQNTQTSVPSIEMNLETHILEDIAEDNAPCTQPSSPGGSNAFDLESSGSWDDEHEIMRNELQFLGVEIGSPAGVAHDDDDDDFDPMSLSQRSNVSRGGLAYTTPAVPSSTSSKEYSRLCTTLRSSQQKRSDTIRKMIQLEIRAAQGFAEKPLQTAPKTVSWDSVSYSSMESSLEDTGPISSYLSSVRSRRR